MRNRIWYEFIDSYYYIQYLGLEIKKLELQNKWVDNISMLLSFGSIAGWYKYADYHVIWASLLTILNGAKLMKSKLMTSESEISTLKSVLEFYIDQARKLENLWIQYNKDGSNDDEVELIFEKLRDEERLMMKINKHGKIEGKEPIKSKAAELANQYFSRITF